MACKTCTGTSNCGCSNCHCKETDICKSNEELSESIYDKLSLLKDYVCVLGASTCQSIIKAVAKYAFFIWCFLRDITNIVLMHDKRLDCLEERINSLTDYIVKEAMKNVKFGLNSKGSQAGPVYTKVTTDSDGSFKFVWTMSELDQSVGSGTVSGKVDHDFKVNKDGSIKVSVKTVKINTVSYNATATGSRGPARFVIKDKNNNVVFDKTYNAYQGWTENPNKTITYNFEKDLEPDGESTGDYLLLKTEDTWETNPTYGEISINYTNNNGPITILDSECGRCVADKEEEGDANA